MMPHKYWEAGGLIVLLALYFSGIWYGVSKAAASGWKWNYCLIAGVLIVVVGVWLIWFLRGTRRIR